MIIMAKKFVCQYHDKNGKVCGKEYNTEMGLAMHLKYEHGLEY